MEPNKRRNIFWALDIKSYFVFLKNAEETATVAQKGLVSGKFVSSPVRKRLSAARGSSRGKQLALHCREQTITPTSCRGLLFPVGHFSVETSHR